MIVIPDERVDAFKRAGWWGETRLGDLLDRAMESHSDVEALVDPPNIGDVAGLIPQRLTWSQVRDGVDRRAAVLAAHGIVRDDVVIVQLPNGVELTLVLLACFQIGAIASPVPAQYRLSELSMIAERTGATAAVTVARIGRHDHAAAMLALRATRPTLQTVFVAGDAPAGTVALDKEVASVTDADLRRSAAQIAAKPPTADDVATICWTSGTEAAPKGVPRSHNEWIILGEGNAQGAELEQGVRLLNPFPMVNMAGISTGLVTWLITKGVLVQHHPFDLPLFLQQVRDERIEYTIAAPAVLTLLLDKPELMSGIDFTRLKRIGSGSAPLSNRVVHDFHERFGVEIINIFGSNEGACFVATLADVPDAADRATCFPRLGDHGFDWRYAHADRVKTRLVDPETEQEIAVAGQPGELRVKGPTIFSGYWDAPESTARAFDDEGWFRTGDLFAIAGVDDRYYRFVGRLKDVIIRGGMNISAEEIENNLLGHPGIREVAVVGAPDEALGERLCACVVGDEGLDLTEINRFLVHECQVAVFKQIERLELLDALPRNPIGKVLKRDLRAMVAGGSTS
jgi:acyl-CoA synthetase (AMP-forming)/AMP-acid ligase II